MFSSGRYYFSPIDRAIFRASWKPPQAIQNPDLAFLVHNVEMKRCPDCQFIYPDSDTICDFDQTLLVAAAESEIASIKNPPEQPPAHPSTNLEKRRNLRALPLIVGLIL